MWQILNCNFVIHIVLRVGLMSKLDVCQLDRLISCLADKMFPPGCACGSVSGRDEQLRVETEQMRSTVCSGVGIMQATEDLDRIENKMTSGLFT